MERGRRLGWIGLGRMGYAMAERLAPSAAAIIGDALETGQVAARRDAAGMTSQTRFAAVALAYRAHGSDDRFARSHAE